METSNKKMYRKEYYQKNKKRLNASSRKYYLENKETVAASILEWQRNNKEHLSEYKKKYYRDNPKTVAKWRRVTRIRKGLSPEPRVVMTLEEANLRQRRQALQRYRDNKEEINEKARIKFRSDPDFREKRREYEAEWRKKNKDRVREYYTNKQ